MNRQAKSECEDPLAHLRRYPEPHTAYGSCDEGEHADRQELHDHQGDAHHQIEQGFEKAAQLIAVGAAHSAERRAEADREEDETENVGLRRGRDWVERDEADQNAGNGRGGFETLRPEFGVSKLGDSCSGPDDVGQYQAHTDREETRQAVVEHRLDAESPEVGAAADSRDAVND